MFDDENDSAFPFKSQEKENINRIIKPEGFTFRQAAADSERVPLAEQEKRGTPVSVPKNTENKDFESKKTESAKTESAKTESAKTESVMPESREPKPISALDKYKKEPPREEPKEEAPKASAPAPEEKATASDMQDRKADSRKKKKKDRKHYNSDLYEKPLPVPDKQKKRHNKGIIALVSVITTLAVAYVVVAVYFKFHILPRTTIDGIDCSYKSISEVEGLLKEEVSGYQLTLNTVDGKSYIIKSAEIGLNCNVGNELKVIFDNQHIFAWPRSFFKDTEISAELKLEYDKEKLSKKTSSFGILNTENSVAPVEAKLTGYTPSGGFQVSPAVFGNTINEEVFETQLRRSILSLQRELNLKEMHCYVEPLYTEDSEDFAILKKSAQRCVNSKVTYTFGGMNESIELKDFLPWLTLDSNKELTLDENSLLEFVQGISAKYTSTNNTRAFKTSYGEIVNIPSRTYGFQVDTNAEAEKLKENLLSGQEVSRAPVFVDQNGNGVKDFGNSYVEINLGMQHLFLYKDGTKVFECDIVSGLPSTGAATPPGIFAIYYCKRNAILRGPGYASPVSYWMPFNGGIGIHDATWQPRFGYDRYLRNGSHGCINVSLQSAATIFGYVEAGFPVIVYHYGTAEREPGIDPSWYEVKNTENAENTENTENADNTGNTENTENTDNTENTGNTENTENVQNNEEQQVYYNENNETI